jgi:UDP-3-O-[3-hydroxymyristoyl] glucosamine N-acyltransferase
VELKAKTYFAPNVMSNTRKQTEGIHNIIHGNTSISKIMEIGYQSMIVSTTGIQTLGFSRWWLSCKSYKHPLIDEVIIIIIFLTDGTY